MRWLSALSLTVALVLAGPAVSAGASGTWAWPVVGPVIRGFDPPDSPYGSGHRGIDIAAPVGTPVHAADAGKVTFAGPVGGRLFVTVDHGGGLVSTYSFLSRILVRKNDLVTRGQVIALSGEGHPGETPTHLHMGAKLNGAYVDPLAYLEPGSVVDLIRLAPLAAA
jgi:murein DD-endopeptidase MepM/ murein hydrolase activator NlpD